MTLNIKARLYFFVKILKGECKLFQCVDQIGKLKLFVLSFVKILFSTYAPELRLRFNSLTFFCLGAYEMHLYPEIFIDKAYSQILTFEPKFFKEGYIVFDVGANVGFYSIFVSSINPSGKIYAFEPHPQALIRLKKNLGINKIRNVAIIEKAIWSKEVNINFEANKYTVLSRIAEGQKSGIAVNVITLDSFVKHHGLGKIDILKIDAEFAEDEIILGAMTRALAITEKIVFEYHSEEKKNTVEKILETHGFIKALEHGSILYYVRKSD